MQPDFTAEFPDIAERVSKGTEWLDKVRPGWAERVEFRSGQHFLGRIVLAAFGNQGYLTEFFHRDKASYDVGLYQEPPSSYRKTPPELRQTWRQTHIRRQVALMQLWERAITDRGGNPMRWFEAHPSGRRQYAAPRVSAR